MPPTQDDNPSGNETQTEEEFFESEIAKFNTGATTPDGRPADAGDEEQPGADAAEEPDDVDDSDDGGDEGSADSDDLVDSDDDSEEDDDSDEGEDEDDLVDRQRRRSNKPAKKRIAELTKARREAERRAEEAEARLQALEGGSKQEDKSSSEDAPSDDAEDGLKEPDFNDYEYGEVDPAYLRDTVKYTLAMERKAQKAEEAEQQKQAAVAQKATEIVNKLHSFDEVGAAKYEDYHEKVREGAKIREDGTAGYRLSPEMAELVADSQVGADMLYHLASNPGVAARIADASPLEQARQMGRLEARYLASSKASEADTPPKPPKATQPPKHRARGAGGRFSTPANTKDFAAFEKMVRSEENF